MNFKKTWKRANDGFTLVELIVVIATLATPAGIAVPAYSGYIKKANKAADLQLLGAVNTAFAAAALENGDDVNDLTSATAKMPIRVDGTINYSSIQPAEYKEAFSKYFEGNTGTFKVITSLVFSNGAFGENEGGSGSLTKEQLQTAMDKYNSSNMAGKEESLVASVGNLSGMLAGRIDDNTVSLKTYLGDDYDAFMSDYGLTEDSNGTEQANAAIMYGYC